MSRSGLEGRSRVSLKERLGRDRLFQLSADLPRLVELDVAAIAPNPEQPRARLDEAALAELRASIARHGLLQPILVRRGEPEGPAWVLVAGQRRLAAVKALGRATIPAILVAGEPGEVALVENLQRQELDPFETAAAVQRLMQRHGYSQAAMGAILGLKQNTVSALLALNRLPARIRAEYPTSDRVSKSLLIELAAVPDEALQLRLWDEVKAGGLGVRALRAARRAAPGGPARPRPAPLASCLAEARRLLARLEKLPPVDPAEPALAALAAVHAALGRRLASLRRGPGRRKARGLNAG
ncbi:ParB/RepB/Spo0J family partition protein [Benzoatithermus flavus]|uniref:ParB/RepB/Spo0J family partition protein n=1 Tax=Benzoatithermus flavus TaxID=3108223 RepID=A0ABU8XVY3_9PROT